MIKEIKTLPDNILEFIESHTDSKKKFIKVQEIRKKLKMDKETSDYWLEFMAEQGLVELVYPMNVLANPKVRVLPYKEKKIKTLEYNHTNRSLLDEYTFESDKLKAKVKIWKVPTQDVPLYDLITPHIHRGTEAMMTGVLDSLTKEIPITTEDISDSKKLLQLKVLFMDKLTMTLNQRLPKEEPEVINTMAAILLHKMYGLGKLEVILADDNLEELAINGSKVPVSVYHKKFGWCKTLQFISEENKIFNLSSQIGRKSGQEINSLHPIMDAHLLSGDRVASTLYPISTKGNTITIRRFARSPWTLTQLLEAKLFSTEVAAFIWMAMQYELNIIIAGGTASGKTSVLNALCAMIPPRNRVISIEDTREIQLPESLHWNWVPMSSKNANPEGEGEISMLDLIVASLRMRPDRILVGEIRKKEQAEALFEAMHTGHSVYATMHADTAEQVKRRLLEPPISVPKTELGSLHLICMQFRDRKTGKRRSLEVVEVIDNKDDIELNYLYRWHPRTDTFEKVNPSRRIFEDLSLHTGLTPKDIEADIQERSDILRWMINYKANDINTVGLVMRIYYKDKRFLYDAIAHGLDVNQALEKFETGKVRSRRKLPDALKGPKKKGKKKKSKGRKTSSKHSTSKKIKKAKKNTKAKKTSGPVKKAAKKTAKKEAKAKTSVKKAAKKTKTPKKKSEKKTAPKKTAKKSPNRPKKEDKGILDRLFGGK